MKTQQPGKTEDKTRQLPWPEDQPMVPVWPTAARPFNLGRSRAYQLARTGEFPVEVLRVASSWMVRTADLRRELGLQVYKQAS